MRKDSLALMALSLMISLAFTGCNYAGTAGRLPTNAPTAPPGPSMPIMPILPTGTSASRAPANTDGAETVLIPGGTFWMGSVKNDPQADAGEMPRHQVTLEPFYIYTHEVTNAMYAACVKAGACIPVTPLKGGPTSHADDTAFAEHPAVGVDWLMARDYCAWANGRLPTEAEWELAARGAESLIYPWGKDAPTCDRVNMMGCLTPPDTVKAGSFKLGNSPYDAWDMAGNVWEWVHDWYDEGYYFFSPAASPLGSSYSETKVIRGGGLYSKPVQLRTAARMGADPNRAYDDVGFRCVPMPELSLPAGYTPVEESHERVAPDPLDGGGEHVEEADPDPHDFFELRRISAACPAADSMRFSFAISASAPLTLTASVDGNRYGCEHDAGTGTFVCDGPVPAAYRGSGRVTVEWFVEGEGISACGAWPVTLPTPAECGPGGGSPVSFSGRAACPEGGQVTLTLDYEPLVRWDLIQLDGVNVPCWPVSPPTRMYCIVPEREPGDSYFLHLHGTDAEGDFHTWWPMIDLPRDCAPEQMDFNYDAVCDGDRPVVRLATVPPSWGLESMSVGGTPLTCMATGPGHYVCGDLPGPAGSTVTVSMCLAGDPCTEKTLTVPDCPAAGTEIAFGILPDCVAGLGPVVTINYSPADQPLVSARADSTELSCEALPGPGLYMCSGVPGGPGAELTITFCLADGSCRSGSIRVRDCSGGEPSGGPWRLASAGCHDETRVFFLMDTGLDWLVPGARFTYHAGDGLSWYACSIVPSVPGRLYCSGPRPGSPGPLEVCIQQDGASSMTCNSFDRWPYIESSIADCAPTPRPPSPTCSSYTDGSSCTAAGCRWDKGPPARCVPP